MLSAIIFDLDGLLVDSTTLQWDATRKFLESFKKLDFSTHSGSEGKRIFDIILDLKDSYDLPGEIEELYEKRQRIFYELVVEKLELFPDALPLLEKLSTRNFKLALGTSGDRGYVELLFHKFPRLKKYFDVVITGDEVENGKPYPDIYLKVAQKLKVKPLECVVLEDSVNGIMAGKQAGMSVITVPNVHYPDADYSQADAIFDNLLEVAQAIPG